MRIDPTIGRIVWFFPPIDGGRHEDGQPFGSMIAGVNDGGTINLQVAARDGSPYGASNVLLVQDGDPIDQDKAHAVWMPYQKGQAAKTEALQAGTGPAPAVDLQPVHDKIAGVETATQVKFEELGGWLTKMFSEFEGKLAALKTPNAAPAPQQEPNAAPAADAGTASQAAPAVPGAAPQTA
jgi:hypothetical protein